MIPVLFKKADIGPIYKKKGQDKNIKHKGTKNRS